MKIVSFACLAVAMACSAFATDDRDRAILAAMKIVEERNYSWTATFRSGAALGRSSLEGRITPDGYAAIEYQQPQRGFIAEIAALNGGQARAIFKGNTRSVFETSRGWKTTAELANGPLAPRASTPVGDAMRRIHIAASFPHEAIQAIVATAINTDATPTTFRGDLTPAGARQLAFPHFDRSLVPDKVHASFHLTFANGRLATIETILEGTARMTSGDHREIRIDRAVTYHLHDLGTTHVDLPAEAKRKLDR